MTVTKVLQGVTPTTIEDTDYLQFAGASFDDPITVNAYNDTTHVESSAGADDSSGNTPNNVKFVSQAGGTGGDSQADWGDGTEDLDAITNAEATLKITVAHDSAIAVTNISVYGYDGTTTTNVPTGVDLRIAEVGDTNWTEAEGSAAALSLTDQETPATSHDFYLAISESPTSIGEKVAQALRIEFTYY